MADAVASLKTIIIDSADVDEDGNDVRDEATVVGDVSDVGDVGDLDNVVGNVNANNNTDTSGDNRMACMSMV